MSHNRNDPSGQSLELELDPTPQAPSVARAAVNGFASGLDIDSTAVATLQLLVSEIVTNAVIHPSTERGSKIGLKAWLSAGVLRVEVLDRGTGFTPTPRDPRGWPAGTDYSSSTSKPRGGASSNTTAHPYGLSSPMNRRRGTSRRRKNLK